MGFALKSAFVAAAVLFPVSLATAQLPKPPKAPGQLEIIQILSLKKMDAATYDLSARLDDGKTIELRMNAFVAQDLSRQLGNFTR
jgi:hypothetical protein